MTAPPCNSLLVPLDLSSVSDRVVGRVALLPLARRTRLTLLHVVPRTLSRRAQQRAQRDALAALAQERRNLVEALPRGVTVERMVTVGTPATQIITRARAARAELVVMGRGGGRGLRDLVLGSTAERVIRRAQLPVLAVRRSAHHPYQHPALALDLDQGPEEAVRLLLRLVALPRPDITVIHAYEVPYRGLIYPSLSHEDAEEHRERHREKAIGELTRQLESARIRAKLPVHEAWWWRILVRSGDPRRVIETTVTRERTDVLALPTRGYRGIAHAFLGTVAGDVLRQVACDVLVVPPRRKAVRTG
jgi:nucleotide-binding universal stress UspA family protein